MADPTGVRGEEEENVSWDDLVALHLDEVPHTHVLPAFLLLTEKSGWSLLVHFPGNPCPRALLGGGEGTRAGVILQDRRLSWEQKPPSFGFKYA